MVYHTLLLDADNTLFDFDIGERLALKRVMEERAIPFTAENETLYEGINRRQWEAFERGEVTQAHLLVERFRLFSAAIGDGSDPVAFNRDFLGYLGQSSHLIDGAEALCWDLAQKYRLAMATNGVAATQWSRLKASPLLPYFDGIYISEEVGYSKPDPRFFDAMLDDLAIADRAGVLMIGDTLSSDIRGGQNAGLDTLWYNPKGKGLTGLAPTYVVTNYEGIRNILLI